MRTQLPVALLCVGLLISATCGWAVETGSGESVTYGRNRTIDDDLLTAARQVTVESTVKGDLTAAGNTVYVSGPVQGSVMLAGNMVNVTGAVGNDAWLAGSQVSLGAPVGDNVYLAGSSVIVTDKSRIGRDLMVGGASVDLMGDVGRDLRAGANNITISGKIGRDAHIRAQNVKLSNSAVINGNLYYPRDAKASIAKSAVIRGHITKTSPIGKHKEKRSFLAALLRWFTWLVASILFGFALVALFPIRAQQTIDTVIISPWASLGIGLVAFIVIPIAAIILMITVIGLPIGLALLLVYPVLLFAGYVLAAAAISQLILRRYRPAVTSLLVDVALGLLVLFLVGLIPFFGGFVQFIAMLMGLGAMLISWWRSRQPRTVEVAPPSSSLTP